MATAKRTSDKGTSDKAPTPRAPTREASTQRVTMRRARPSTARWNDAVESRDELVERKRIALIRAAGSAFKARGFHNTSLDDVAASLNVTKPTLYYYIDSKQDLLYRCHDHALDLGELALEFGREGVNGLDRLQRTLGRYIESLTDDFAAYSVLSDLHDLSPKQFAAIQKRRRRFDEIFRGFVSEGIADGSIRPCNPMLAVAWFMGSVNAIPRWFDHTGPMSGSEVAAAYVDLITRGLRA
jgi:TetR/AcrR family transcriptional regulator